MNDDFEESDQTHEDMLVAYVEYYNIWDSWVQKRSVRDYYKMQRAAKKLHVIMKTHHKALVKDFYSRTRPRSLVEPKRKK
jgi:hypothetical protein